MVGTSELSGLDADRVIHVESAGMGRGVDGPGDFINYVQGAPGGHGADPDDFDGTTRLETGNYRNGDPISGFGAHSGVFKHGSGAWKNMLDGLTGGTVTTDDYTETVVVPPHIGPYQIPGFPSVEHVHHPSEEVDIE